MLFFLSVVSSTSKKPFWLALARNKKAWRYFESGDHCDTKTGIRGTSIMCVFGNTDQPIVAQCSDRAFYKV